MPKFRIRIGDYYTFAVDVEANSKEEAESEAIDKFIASSNPFKDFNGSSEVGIEIVGCQEIK